MLSNRLALAVGDVQRDVDTIRSHGRMEMSR
jgi:hypothetical protein